MPDLLIEILSEEIPARMQTRAANDLKRLVTDGLVEAGLTYGGAEALSTPRRLVLAIEGLAAESPARREERKGPRVDAPEKALEGFLRSTGLAKDQLEARDDKKGQVWFAVIEHAGRPAAEVVAEVLAQTIHTFPWPKSMRWGAGELRWVRPLQGLICILTDESGPMVVPVRIGDGVAAGDVTQGHRVHAPAPVRVTGFDDYAAKLRAAHVLVSHAEREERIWHDATTLAFAQGLEVVEDRALLSEVAGLVEWPVALMGEIDAAFLDLPAEVLQTSMREHQKFFSVRNPGSGRIERYITVANVETEDAGAAILHGNGKVLKARLADAKFFWENDLRKVRDLGLDGMAAPLQSVTFHAKLGSQAARVARIEALARVLAPLVGADTDLAGQAARVAKADLASEMVYEFPELQGIMGRYYAEAQGLPGEVARACAEHYAPLGPSDDVPAAPVSAAVALADKLDILTGFWAIDEKPTGSKDPYALRRAALGVIRLILSNGLRIPLLDVLAPHFARSDADIAATVQGQGPDALAPDDAGPDPRGSDLLGFLHDRLKVHLRDEGLRHDVIDASLAMPGGDDLVLLVARARALQVVLGTDDGENLIQGFKRANNILSQAEAEDGVEYSFGPDPKLAETDTERALFAALDAAEAKIAPAMTTERFEEAMAAMAKLRGPIDAFFEDVQVNSDNAIIRRNRLNLLHRIRQTCGAVADLSQISG